MTTTDLLSDLSTAARAASAAAGPATVAIGRHGRGTGVVVAPGKVLTNAHNLRDRTTQVTFADGRAVQGRLAGAAPDHDLVVLDVDTAGAPSLPWSTRTLEEGDPVFAAGRTLRGHRVTFGLVSAADRAFRGPRGRRIKGAVEHTAPLAKGSSGGPLLDAEGAIVGINTHRLGEGFYLALPADADLQARVAELVEGRSVGGRRLGVAVVPAAETARIRRRVGLPEQAGLLVSGVLEGSPAEAAGLGEGDLVVAVGGAAVTSVDDVWDALDRAGDTVDVEVVRGTEARTVTVSFAAPSAPATSEPDDAADPAADGGPDAPTAV
ncbi:S1C family serine protease [Aquihabitans sp. G128]|uniref:S1C family serine protease n=1 Tax=Aquihabitans sp. G128 TaxID=2849779 RepID=UPI001C2369F9|nr:trypsin-like peptidase domain-containing protein [Aquihabitans sp. G128]QXC59453.1 S1C family serine protease [Aquihabitans sp. G128]